MYSNLKAEIVRNNMTYRDLAKLLGVTEQTIRRKVTGESDFDVSEGLTIRNTLFPSLEFDYLFKQIVAK